MVNLSCIDIEWDVTNMSVGTLEVAYKFPWKFPFPMFGHNMYVWNGNNVLNTKILQKCLNNEEEKMMGRLLGETQALCVECLGEVDTGK